MMKKFSLMFATAAIVAGGVLTASCSDSDNESSKEVVVKEIVLDQEKTIQLTSNADTKFTIGNVSKTGKEVEFVVDGNSATIKAEVDGFVPQEANIDFSKNQNASAILIDMMKKSTNLVGQEEAKGHSVVNDAANQQATGVVSAIEVPADVVITGNTTDPFAITAFVPAPDVVDVDNVKTGDEVAVPVLGFECDPDGALFDKPVTISATIPGIEGFDIDVPGAKNLVCEGDKVSFTVAHFSKSFLRIKAKLRKKTLKSKQIHNVTLAAKNGSLEVPFMLYAGFEGNPTKWWKNYATSMFGSPLKQIKKKIKVIFEGTGSVIVVIDQNVHELELVSGSQTLLVSVMGDITPTATGKADQGHSAGSANGI